MAAICCQALARAWRAAGCSGTVSSTASAAVQDLGPLTRRQGGVQRLDLGRGGLLARLQVAAGRGQGRLRRPRRASRSARSSWSWARPNSPRRASSSGVLPGLGDLAGPPQRRAADLVPGQGSIRSTTRAGSPASRSARTSAATWSARLSRAAARASGAAPSRSARSRSSIAPARSSASPRRAARADQLVGEPPAELDRVVVVGHVGPAGQGERLVVAPGPRGLLRLSQDDAPVSQHG